MSLTPFFLGIDPFLNTNRHTRRGDERNGNTSPFSTFLSAVKPAIDLHEENDTYVVEAEVPGVKREDIDVQVGDNGKSVTISGKTHTRRSWRSGDSGANEMEGETAGQPSGASSGAKSKEVARRAEGTVSNSIASERSFVGSSTFTRTVWLPRAVDGSKVVAKLQDGVLTLMLPKQQDLEAVRVSIQ